MRPNEKDKRNMIYSQLFQNNQYNAMNKSPVDMSDIDVHTNPDFEMVRYNRDEIQESISVYGDMVYRMALIQSGNTESADILYQKTFSNLVRKKDFVPAGETRKRWLVREVTSCKCRRKGYPSANVITECVYKLSKQKRIIFHLHFYEKYSSNEISGILKISERDINCYIESILKEMPNILEAERVWESENYIARYQEEMSSVKHDSMLDEKIKDRANRPIPKITGKTIAGYFLAFATIAFCLWGAWDTIINTYHFDKSFTYLINSIEKVDVYLDETKMVDFTPEQYEKVFGTTKDSGQEPMFVYKDINTYEELYDITGIEIFGANVLEWDTFVLSIHSKQYPVSQRGIIDKTHKIGQINGLFTYLEENYRLEIYFKVKDYTNPDEFLGLYQKKVNYSYEYAEGKYANFKCTGTKSSPISQDIYFVEDGMLYILSQVEATMEATEKVKDLLDLMAGNK
jgi:RNA polymerase sigma-70 factor (ECF subfamily)